MEPCPFQICDGSGWILMNADGRVSVSECRCRVIKRQKEKVEKMFRNNGIPPRFRYKTFENFNYKEYKTEYLTAKQYAEKFSEISKKPKNGLCFIGPTGTGKSHLAYAILNFLLERGINVVAKNVPELLDMLRPGKRESELIEERMELIKTSDLLLLDDLGAERNSPWASERLYIIINHRYCEMLPVILTLNIPLEELENSLEWERITSRIYEMCYILIMDGDDYRKKDLREVAENGKKK